MKKFVSFVLCVLMLHAFSLVSLATDSSLERAKKAQLAAEVKSGISQLGTGKSSIVRVVLYDKTKYHGYITEIGNDSFVVDDAKTGNKAEIAYPEVKGVKGKNFSTATKIGIGVAIAAPIAVIIAIVSNGKDDNNEGPFDPRCVGVRAPCP
jgi:hypothetical protein